MNEKITFPRLAALLADKSGRSKRFSEDFLREFFAIISECLEAGDSVKVKGLGTFKLSRVEPRRSVDVTTGQPMEISGHSKVVFIPSKELAEAVNAPFEAFTAIEIGDDADLSQILSQDDTGILESEEIDDEMDDKKESEAHAFRVAAASEETTPKAIITSDEAAKTVEEESHEENEENEEPKYAENPIEEVTAAVIQSPEDIKVPLEPASEAEGDEEPKAEEVTAPDDGTSKEESEEEYVEEEEEYEEEPRRRKTWVRTLMISLGAALFALIATFAVWYVFTTNDFNRIFNRTDAVNEQKPKEGFVVGQSAALTDDSNALTAEDSVSEAQAIMDEPEVPTAPSDPVVYDTISTTRYLTTMAKAHYGNYNLWPYIYEENKAILGHPDRIRPGTPVVVPKLSKYGVDPTNADDIEKAKKMGIEIYARYGKKI